MTIQSLGGAKTGNPLSTAQQCAGAVLMIRPAAFQYNPQTEPSTINVDEDKVRAWISKGATATPQVRKLLRTQGIDVAAR